MAPRKDMMRIIRQDARFSAKLGFGSDLAASVPRGSKEPKNSIGTPVVDPQASVTDEESAIRTEVDARNEALMSERAVGSPREERRAVQRSALGLKGAEESETSVRPVVRGQVVYVAISLTSRQAVLAERWAAAARCSVQFLIRRVAQGIRDEVFFEWAANGIPVVDELRGARGRHPTSVTMTLPPEFASLLAERYDPMGLLGLARVMGPAFRARFETAFDRALAKSGFDALEEGGRK